MIVASAVSRLVPRCDSLVVVVGRTFTSGPLGHTLDSGPARNALDGYIDTTSVEYTEGLTANRPNAAKFQSILCTALAGGGEKGAKRHVEVNRKLLVRDRLKLLLDDRSDFLEIATVAGCGLPYADIPGAGSVVGIGLVQGRACVVQANDATVKGGSIYPIAVKKQLRMQEICDHLNLPAVYLVDSGGAFLPLQASIFPDKEHGGRAFYNMSVLGARGVPQISVVCGSCTAGAAYIPSLSDDTVIVHRIGSMFLAGPPLVRAALGEDVSSEDLGGADVHCRSSGGTDYFAANEPEAFDICRDIVEALPFDRQDCLESPSDQSRLSTNNTDPTGFPRFDPGELEGIAGMAGLSGRRFFELVVSRIVDDSRFVEFRQLYGSSIVCGFAAINGVKIGIVSTVGEPLEAKSCLKASHFVAMCDQREVPLLFLVRGSGGDGWSLKNNEEHDECGLKCVAQLMSTVSCCSVAKIVLHTGNSCGAENLAMCGRAFDPTFVFAWPNAQFAMVNPDSELDGENSIPPDFQSVIRAQADASSAAGQLWIDDVVLPQETRAKLTLAFRYAVIGRRYGEQVRGRQSRSDRKAVMRM